METVPSTPCDIPDELVHADFIVGNGNSTSKHDNDTSVQKKTPNSEKDSNGAFSQQNSGNHVSQSKFCSVSIQFLSVTDLLEANPTAIVPRHLILRVFHPFKKLPPELRMMIWCMASFENGCVYRIQFRHTLVPDDYGTISIIQRSIGSQLHGPGDVGLVPGILTACQESFKLVKGDYYRCGTTGFTINAEYSTISMTPWFTYKFHPSSFQPEIESEKSRRVKRNLEHGVTPSQIPADECHDIARDIAESSGAYLYPWMEAPVPDLLRDLLPFLRGARVLSAHLSTGPYTFDQSWITQPVHKSIELWARRQMMVIVNFIAKEVLPYCSNLESILLVADQTYVWGMVTDPHNPDRSIPDPNNPEDWDYSSNRHLGIGKGYVHWSVRWHAIQKMISEIRARGVATRHGMRDEDDKAAHLNQEEEHIAKTWKSEWRGIHPPLILSVLELAIPYCEQAFFERYGPSRMPKISVVFKESPDPPIFWKSGHTSWRLAL